MYLLLLLLLFCRKIFVSLLLRLKIPHIMGKYLYLDYFAAKLVTNRKGSLSKFRTASCIHEKPMMKKKKVSREEFCTSSEKIRIVFMLPKMSHLFGKDSYLYYFFGKFCTSSEKILSLLLHRKTSSEKIRILISLPKTCYE